MVHIDHLGIAVEEIESSLKKYELLGLTVGEKHKFEEAGLEIQFIDAGGVKIELLQPLAEGTIKNFLEKRGPGLHHIAFQVEDIELQLKRLSREGMELIDEEPRTGFGGSKIAFIHPRSMNGVLVELVQSH
jgi:methylmalonyl-CoA/ethylmalonyl-CoA epimerase